jgi:hypothetical protein
MLSFIMKVRTQFLYTSSLEVMIKAGSMNENGMTEKLSALLLCCIFHRATFSLGFPWLPSNQIRMQGSELLVYFHEWSHTLKKMILLIKICGKYMIILSTLSQKLDEFWKMSENVRHSDSGRQWLVPLIHLKFNVQLSVHV